MRYVTSYERFVMEKGRVQTARQFVLQGLDLRFGSVPPVMSERIKDIDDSSKLNVLHKYTFKADSISAFEQKLDEVTSVDSNAEEVEE